MENLENESSLGDSMFVRLVCSAIGSPISWWVFIIFSLYLMERFQLGTHSLPWNYWRRKSKVSPQYVKEWRNGFKHDDEAEDVDGCMMTEHLHAYKNGVRHVNGLSNRPFPQQFKEFIRSQVVPKFRMQCKNNEGRFAVLILSHISSLRNTQDLVFRQITFNGKPLVDSTLTTYPEPYRFENYVVAQSTESVHPEVSLVRQIPALLAGFGRTERCYLRDPVPRTGILYCSEMPCSACTELLVESLAGVCKKRTVLAYSQDETKDGKKNFQRLVDAGISVIKIST